MVRVIALLAEQQPAIVLRRLGRASVGVRQHFLGTRAGDLLCHSNKRAYHLVLRHDPHDLALHEKVPAVTSRRNPDVRRSRLAGPVHDAPHHGNLDGHIQRTERVLRSIGDADDVDLRASTRRAGDQVERRPLPKAERLQQLASGSCLLDRVRRQRVADRVADALGEQRRNTSGCLDKSARKRARLGHAEVQRIVDRVRKQSVRLDHQCRVRRFHGDLHVEEALVLEVRQLPLS